MLITFETQRAETTLIHAAQTGDRAAFGALYQQYARAVHGVLLAHVGYSDAEDLLQDVFLKAMERLPALREPNAFCSWLMAIARHAATDHVRRKPLTHEVRPPCPAARTATMKHWRHSRSFNGCPKAIARR